MAKKPKYIASANDRETTGFVTADKFLSSNEDIGVTRKDTEYHQDTPKTIRTRHTTLSKPSLNSNSPKNSRDNLKEVRTSTKEVRTSTNQTPPPISYLSIITDLESGLCPAEISSKLGIPKTTLQYHINKLKKQGVIRMVGYGVWEVLKQPETTKKRSTNSNHIGKEHVRMEVQKNILEYIPDSVRGHAFMYTLQVPKNMRNWTIKKREQYLDRHNIPYKSLKTGGQRLIINECKTILYNKSIVIYDTHSYFAEKAIDAKGGAINSFLKIIKKVERMLHTEFQIGSDYKFRVARQHYALIKNALAEQFDQDGQKLEVRAEGDGSLWFLIDNSFNLHEAETVHPKTAMTDNQTVKDWFNSLKEHPITADFILEAFALSVKNQADLQGTQMAWAENIDTHMDVLRGIGAGIQIFGDKMQTFDDKVQTMNELLQKFADLIKK